MKTSEKQRKQRRLASELWRVTGAIGQLRVLHMYCTNPGVKVSLNGALACLEMAEQRLRNEMKSL